MKEKVREGQERRKGQVRELRTGEAHQYGEMVVFVRISVEVG